MLSYPLYAFPIIYVILASMIVGFNLGQPSWALRSIFCAKVLLGLAVIINLSIICYFGLNVMGKVRQDLKNTPLKAKIMRRITIVMVLNIGACVLILLAISLNSLVYFLSRISSSAYLLACYTAGGLGVLFGLVASFYYFDIQKRNAKKFESSKLEESLLGSEKTFNFDESEN